MKKITAEQEDELVAPQQAKTITELQNEIFLLNKEINTLSTLYKKSKKLLHIYDKMENGEFELLLDALINNTDKQYKTPMSIEYKIGMRQALKDFIESYIKD